MLCLTHAHVKIIYLTSMWYTKLIFLVYTPDERRTKVYTFHIKNNVDKTGDRLKTMSTMLRKKLNDKMYIILLP